MFIFFNFFSCSFYSILSLYFRTQPQSRQSAFLLERVDQSASVFDEYSWVLDSNLWASLSRSTAITTLDFFPRGHKLHFLMNGRRKNQFDLNWAPSFAEIIEGKHQKRDDVHRQKRWQWLQSQKVLIAPAQEKPSSWSSDPRVNKCRLPPCLTDTIPCTVYILQAIPSTTATAQPRPSPGLWDIHTSTQSVAIPPVPISAQCRRTKTARRSHRRGSRTQVRAPQLLLFRFFLSVYEEKSPLQCGLSALARRAKLRGGGKGKAARCWN